MAIKPKITDVRAQIPRANLQNLEKRPLSAVHYLFVHYSADACPADAGPDQELAHLVADARYHEGKDWNPPHGVYGYTIMYTYAIFQSGNTYWCNDEDWLLWNTTYGNGVGLAVVCVLGPGEAPSPAMTDALVRYLDWMTGRPDVPATRANVFGHGECDRRWGQGPAFGNDTDCPGLVLPLVRQYRAGAPAPPPAPPARFFPETGHNLSHGFLDFWTRNGGLPIFGYPLTEEIDGAPYDRAGLTIQWFERACFEYHPDTGDVTLRLVGTEDMSAALRPAVQDH